MELRGDRPKVLNNLAWILATHKDAEIRDGVEAVRLAEGTCQLTDYKAAEFLDTLAVAYAEISQFDKAAETAQRACQLARNAGEEELAKETQRHLDLYRTKRPWRESFGSERARPPG